MAEYTSIYQIITKLPFDPEVSGSKEYDDALDIINKYIKTNLQPDINNTSGAKKQEAIDKKKYIEDKLLTSDKKLNISEYERQKKERLENAIKRFEEIVKSLPNQVLTEQALKDWSKRCGLTIKNVRAIFERYRFEISNIEIKKPEIPSNIKDIESEFENLRIHGKTNKKYEELQNIPDVYSFIEYLDMYENNGANIVKIKSRKWEDLKTVVETYAKQYPGAQPSPRDIFVRLCSMAYEHLFKDGDKQKKYDFYLKYNHKKMLDIIDNIQIIAPETLKDPAVADPFIEKIQTLFGDNDNTRAISIYNIEAGLKDNPYIPSKKYFYLKCGECDFNNKYLTKAEMDKATLCQNCGHKLYMNCNNCGHKVPVSVSQCSNCGYNFSTLRNYVQNKAKAEEALRTGDIVKARQYLTEAKIADPSKEAELSALSKKIDEMEEKIKKPLSELKQLIAERKFEAASAKLPHIIKAFPSLNISADTTTINQTLSKARTQYDSAAKNSSCDLADECLKILQDCHDFKLALDYLSKTQPKKLSSIKISPDLDDCSTTISWSSTGQSEIRYFVVRKEGKQNPTSIEDGKKLTPDGIKASPFKDTSITAGKYYCYSVFTERRGLYSEATVWTQPVLLLAEVKNINQSQDNAGIHLSWVKPNNCSSVTVSRVYNNTETILTKNANSSYDDAMSNLSLGESYLYILKANYAGMPSSNGKKTPPITPGMIVEDFTISHTHISGNKYKIYWDIKFKGIDLRILVNQKEHTATKSDKVFCEIQLPPNEYITLTVAALSGDSWKQSQNNIIINTYQPLRVDKASSKITNEAAIASSNGTKYTAYITIKISESITNNVVGFWYCVRTKSTAMGKDLYAKENEKSLPPDAIKIEKANIKNNEILINRIIHNTDESCHLTLFTIYNVGGKEIISAPEEFILRRPEQLNVFWRIIYPSPLRLLEKKKLEIEVTANRPFSSIPPLILFTGRGGNYVRDYLDVNAVKILTTKEQVFSEAQTEVKMSFQIANSSLIQRGKFINCQSEDTSCIPRPID